MTNRSYWLADTRAPGYPSASADLDVDLAVVGAGVAGLCVAWEAVRAGLSVAVFEAGHVASGTSGNTTAKVTAQHGLIYARLAEHLGVDAAITYGRTQRDALEHLVAMAHAIGTDVQLERRDAWVYVTAPERADELRREADIAQRAGLPAALDTDTGLPFDVHAAVRVKEQAQIHPTRFLDGIAADIVRLGGHIHEQDRVVALDEGAPCRLSLASGVTVRARDVAVCTGFPIFDRVRLYSRLSPRRELVLAAPIHEQDDPGGMFITPEQHIRSVRTAPLGDGHRLLIVTGEAHRTGTGGERKRLERLTAWLTETFGPREIDYHWSAQDNDTPDGVPYIGRLSPHAAHVYVATGFGGWGFTNGVLAGRLILGHITGEPPEWAGLYDPGRIALSDVPSVLRSGVAAAERRTVDRFRAAPPLSEANDLRPGDVAILGDGTDRVAAYRDDEELHLVSAVCTHMGCVVAWNDVEQTWDCPCHGSRFTPDGEVLNGPAVDPLEPRRQ